MTKRILSQPGGFLVAQKVKRLPAMQETWVRFLDREDPLKKQMAIHYSTLAWKITWTEKPDRLKSMGLQRVGHDWVTSLLLSTNSLYACLAIILHVYHFWYFNNQKNFTILQEILQKFPIFFYIFCLLPFSKE